MINTLSLGELPFMRLPKRLSVLRFVSSVILLILGIYVPHIQAQTEPTACLNLPSDFVPFDTVYYTTTANANGDLLVVGSMALGPVDTFNVLLSQIPLPSAPNQQICGSFQIAPGFYVQAYVPTAAERYGDFHDFQNLLVDPNPNIGNGRPFAGGIIPMFRLPDPFAWRIRSLQPAPTVMPAAALHFIPLPPCRVLDTRDYRDGFLRGQSTTDFNFQYNSCGIPFNAKAYSFNVTVVPLKKLGYLTVFPTGQPQPLASILNSLDGRIKANAAVIPAGTNGAISVFATDDTQLILDVNGYFVSASTDSALAFYPVAPCRVADTRGANGSLGGPALSAQMERDFPVMNSACNIPATAKAYALNYTVVPKGPLGYLTTWPTGQSQPFVSTLNAPTGTITANAAIVPAGDNGDISVYATQNTDLIIDINGYFAPPVSGGLSLYALAPCRVYDSRTQSALQPIINTAGVDVTGSSCGAPANAQSYVFNATVVPTNSLLFLTLWDYAGASQPNVSTLNAPDGSITSNLAIVPTTGGSIKAFASHSTHLILDISGYFAP